MILFGTKTVKTPREHGEFFCPQCQARRAHKKRRGRQFFHLYFIPIIPISGGHEFIQCQDCKGEFHLDVLSHDPEKQRAEMEGAFNTAVTNVVAAMIAADGHIDPQEIARATDIVAQVTGAQLPPDEISTLATQALDGRVPVDSTLREVAPHINEHGKEMIVRIALDIAASDDDIAEDELRLIERIAGNLGMSPAHLRGIFAPDPDTDPKHAEDDSEESWR
ncbi:MAG: TerB family tellurite resistance protein [Planctomycetota bacterium]